MPICDAMPDFWYRKWHFHWYLTFTFNKMPTLWEILLTNDDTNMFPSTRLRLDWVVCAVLPQSWELSGITHSKDLLVFWTCWCALFRSACTCPACQHDCKKERLSFAVWTNSRRLFAAASGSLRIKNWAATVWNNYIKTWGETGK